MQSYNKSFKYLFVKEGTMKAKVPRVHQSHTQPRIQWHVPTYSNLFNIYVSCILGFFATNDITIPILQMKTLKPAKKSGGRN